MRIRHDALTVTEKYLTTVSKLCSSHVLLFRHFSEVYQLYVLVNSRSFFENDALYASPHGGRTLHHPDGTHARRLKDLWER